MSCKVSVIIPNYSHAKYLDERIQSVINQTYQDFEIIILDDCSPDDGASKAVIEKYRNDHHISHIIYNDENSGSTFKQWRKGLELAKGDLIWIAESDDKCEATLLETLVGQFLKDKRCVLAYCISVLFCDDGTIIGRSDSPGGDLQMSGDEFIRNHMSVGNAIWNASSALFKKEIAVSIDEQYETFKGAGDRLFWIEIAERGNVSIVKKELNYLRQHPNNSSKRYYATGINQREDKLILDYIYQRGRISKLEYYISKIKYANNHVLFRKFESRKIKEDVINYWHLNRFDTLCVYMYRHYCYLFGKYNRLINRWSNK